jgi:hypothetical protein
MLKSLAGEASVLALVSGCAIAAKLRGLLEKKFLFVLTPKLITSIDIPVWGSGIRPQYRNDQLGWQEFPDRTLT